VQEWKNVNNPEDSVCEFPSIGDNTVYEPKNYATLLEGVKNDTD